MSVSGIYAVKNQIISAELSTGNVDVKIETYKLNNENKEEIYIDGQKTVNPGETISFIPKIENKGENCYIRMKIKYISENIDIGEYSTGMTTNWEKKRRVLLL